MVDTHTHLNLSPLVDDLSRVIQQAKDAGVSHLMVPGVTIETSVRAVQLAREFPNLWAAVGIHPEEAENGRTIEERDTALRKLLDTGMVSAIGECGLDYSGDVDHEAQKKLFQIHIDLALHYDLPLLIHCRNTRRLNEIIDYDAYGDVLHIISTQSSIPKFVLHCVSGPVPYVQEAIQLGAYISFAGNVTYPNAQNIRDILAVVPHDRLLTETDAPFLSPQSKRGQSNTPANVVETGKFMAEFLKMDFAFFERITAENAMRVFQR